MTKRLDGKRSIMLCDLFNIKHIGGQPSAAPKFTMGAEHISRASQALVTMTLVRQAPTSDIAVPPGAEHETWIYGNRAYHDLMHHVGLVLLWWTSRRVTETVDNGTQMIVEDRCAQDVPARIMIMKHGKAAQCRCDCPFLLKSHVISEMVFPPWSERRFRTSSYFFSSQSQRLVALTLIMTRTNSTRHRSFHVRGSDRDVRHFSYPVVLVSVARQCGSGWNFARGESSSLIS